MPWVPLLVRGSSPFEKQLPLPLIQANTDREKPGREALFWVPVANEQMPFSLYLKEEIPWAGEHVRTPCLSLAVCYTALWFGE